MFVNVQEQLFVKQDVLIPLSGCMFTISSYSYNRLDVFVFVVITHLDNISTYIFERNTNVEEFVNSVSDQHDGIIMFLFFLDIDKKLVNGLLP